MKSIFVNKPGFTLVELLVAILILCIIIVVALPALSSMLMDNRLTANTDMFVNALNYARNTALNESMNVIVCPFSAPNSTGCGGNWNTGWIVVSQSNSGTYTLLQSQQFSTTDPTLSGTIAPLVFDPHGLTTTPGNFKLCDSRGGTFARSVEILATGFIQSGSTPGQAVWDNSMLSCP